MQDQPKPVDIDLGRISLSRYPEINAWCVALGCSEVQLAEAIAVVGYSAASVREYLNGSGGPAPRSP
jgi:hypothetical protein